MTRARQDWRLAGPAAGAWLGALAGVSEPAPLTLLVGCGLGVAVGLWALRTGRVRVVAFLVLLVAAGGLAGVRALHLHSDLPAQLAADGAAARVTVRVTVEAVRLPARGNRPEFAVLRGELLEVVARGRTVTARQPVVVMASGAVAAGLSDARPGATHVVTGLLAPAEPGTAEAIVVRARSWSGERSPPGALDTLVNELRAGLRDAMANSPADQAGLLPSLVVGDTARIDDELREDFRATALSHLTAVSGANLSLLLGVVLALARGLGIRGWSVRVVSVGCVALFVVVCRSEPSVVRAAAMGLVAVSAIGFGRGRRSVRNLCLAVLGLLLWDPWLAVSWGFALSVAACFGIAVLAPRWIDVMVTWLPRWLAEALAVPLAAQVATQPLVVALSGQVSVVGVVANLLAGPFVGPATVLGLAAMCLVWCPPLATGVAWAAGWCVQPILWIARWGADLPAAAWAWPATPTGLVLSVVACLAVAVGLGFVVGSRVRSAVLVLLMVAASLHRPLPLGWPGPWQVAFCNVGQGDATVLRAGAGAAVLVDAGPEPRATIACLDSLGTSRIPLLVLTHFHADHVGGAAAVVQRFRPDFVLVSPLLEPAAAAAAVLAEVQRAGGRVVTAVPGQVFRVGDVTWRTVAADRPTVVRSVAGEGESGVENDSSVVGLAEVTGLRVLLPGDVEPSGQNRALSAASGRRIELGAHVLKLPHHGSARQDPRFFAATGARLAVVSAGEDNDYGHPAPAALRLAAAQGMAVRRTDTDGAITVALANGRLDIRTERASPP